VIEFEDIRIWMLAMGLTLGYRSSCFLQEYGTINSSLRCNTETLHIDGICY
jgi:hypothetical protein